jgi:hypothetical protein
LKSFLLTVFLFFLPLVLAADQKAMKLRLLNSSITVDGIIEPEWSKADSVTDFFQLLPYWGKEPSRRTVAKVLASADALYCLVVCYDEPENIQKTTGMLDTYSGDIVSIMIDTFSDKRSAYKFAVTASGVKADSRLLDDARNRDYGWDGVWFADAAVYDWGYVVEMEIPFKSIQYDGNLAAWGLDFDRWNQKRAEDLYWCEYSENEGQRISKFGRLVFEDFRPTAHGLNLEIYPVAVSKATYVREGTYKFEPNAGIDLFYNPSPQLTLQLTGNPDFAQIEADPFSFNISRYESYFDERRPFFTKGNEVFMPSGRERGTGFYRPLELFYSRRIGKKLRDGSEVPLLFGAKAVGRAGDWEYGGFSAVTGGKDYLTSGPNLAHESGATFASARVKKQILGNSSVGILFVGKSTAAHDYGVVDIDGAFRTSEWQLSYQIARSFKGDQGDFGGSAGFVNFSENWMNLARGRYIGADFDVDQVGFVPWRGTWEFVGITGPRWYFEEGEIRQILVYVGPTLSHENVDTYTDRGGVLGFNMQLRSNWGYEVNLSASKSKELNHIFNSHEVSLSSWYSISPRWSANLYGGYARTYNFARNYLAFYAWYGAYFSTYATDIVSIGTSFDSFIEGKPSGGIEDITYNARPFVSLTPVNNLNLRVYVDNVYVQSSDRLQRMIVGFLFSYNFLPKSWVYFAVNEFRDRTPEFDSAGILLPHRLHTVSRAAVAKASYLYYF